MNKYRVMYENNKGHTIIFIYRGKCMQDAIDKFVKRKVYGNSLFYYFTVYEIDAATKGETWQILKAYAVLYNPVRIVIEKVSE